MLMENVIKIDDIKFDTINFDIARLHIDEMDLTDPDLLELLYTAYPALSAKKIREYTRFCKFIQWGRKNPVDFASLVFGIDLLDLQKYAIINSWNKSFVLWLECRNAGKTTKNYLDSNISLENLNKTSYFQESEKENED